MTLIQLPGQVRELAHSYNCGRDQTACPLPGASPPTSRSSRRPFFSFKRVRALQPRDLLLGQAGAKLRLGDQDAADLRLAPIPPNVAAFGDLVDVIFERVAGAHRLAE